jgi:hypothetical protein
MHWICSRTRSTQHLSHHFVVGRELILYIKVTSIRGWQWSQRASRVCRITLNCYLDDYSLRDATTNMILDSFLTIYSPSSSINIFLKTTNKASSDRIASLDYSFQASRLIHVSSIVQIFKSLEATWIQTLLQPYAYEQRLAD